MPRVISYTRFSSARQSHGDSYRRQTDMAQAWCLQNGQELDTALSLEDLGVSGYSGANAKRGALGALQRLCLEGKLESGTVLLIEAFDRLTRLPLPDAYELILSLVNNGLTIVTLTDGKTWTKDKLKNLEDFMLSMVTLYRGHQESSQKSDRLRKTFRQARKINSRQEFGSAPGWLTRDSKQSPWVIHESKAEVVRRVFELSASGLGSKGIAAIANKNGWPVPTRLNRTGGRWHAQMAGIIIRNRAVLGEHEHRIRNHETNALHWQGTGTGIAIPDYYPRIVSDDLYYLARASIETRRPPVRRDSHYYNIWSGLLYCGCCGAPLQRKNETNGYSRATVSCADRLAGITKCPSFAAKNTDLVLIHEIYAYASNSLGTLGGESQLQEIANLEGRLAQKKGEADRITDAIVKTGGDIDSLVKRAVAINDELREIATALDIQRGARAEAESGSAFDDTFFNQAMAHLYTVSDESRVIRASLHLKMARLIDSIFVWAYDLAVVRFKDGMQLTVPLPSKSLPSRAKPDSKHHRPPTAKIATRPYFDASLSMRLVIPAIQRRHELLKKAKPYLIVDDSANID